MPREDRAVESPPPSSRIKRRVVMHIPVTVKSGAMITLAARGAKQADRFRRVVLITPPADAFELISLGCEVFDRRYSTNPYVVQSTDDQVDLELEQSPRRGILVPRSEKLTDNTLRRLERALSASRFQRTVLLNFTSGSAFERHAGRFASILYPDGPPSRRKNNDSRETPLAWPVLTERRRDVPEIIDNLCRLCMSEDGQRMAIVTQDAKAALTHDGCKHVSTLHGRITGAFKVTLQTKSEMITEEHVHIALSPTARRIFFRRG